MILLKTYEKHEDALFHKFSLLQTILLNSNFLVNRIFFISININREIINVILEYHFIPFTIFNMRIYYAINKHIKNIF